MLANFKTRHKLHTQITDTSLLLGIQCVLFFPETHRSVLKETQKDRPRLCCFLWHIRLNSPQSVQSFIRLHCHSLSVARSRLVINCPATSHSVLKQASHDRDIGVAALFGPLTLLHNLYISPHGTL